MPQIKNSDASIARLSRVSTSIFDMTEHDVAEMVELPRVFLDSLGMGVSIVEIETGRIRFANAECCRILGYSLEQLRREHISFLDLTFPDDRENNRAQHDKLLAGEIDRYRIEKR
ncbi:PAS domain-containing protein, partial [Bradyrhizobium sp. STM 3809]|uniref:PAS domain-containing protein n=1 Tax=Bradyrhizobium sp. STM 3809 TaxID=551936 RepID=UPI001F0A0B24